MSFTQFASSVSTSRRLRPPVEGSMTMRSVSPGGLANGGASGAESPENPQRKLVGMGGYTPHWYRGLSPFPCTSEKFGPAESPDTPYTHWSVLLVIFRTLLFSVA